MKIRTLLILLAGMFLSGSLGAQQLEAYPRSFAVTVDEADPQHITVVHVVDFRFAETVGYALLRPLMGISLNTQARISSSDGATVDLENDPSDCHNLMALDMADILNNLMDDYSQALLLNPTSINDWVESVMQILPGGTPPIIEHFSPQAIAHAQAQYAAINLTDGDCQQATAIEATFPQRAGRQHLTSVVTATADWLLIFRATGTIGFSAGITASGSFQISPGPGLLPVPKIHPKESFFHLQCPVAAIDDIDIQLDFNQEDRLCECPSGTAPVRWDQHQRPNECRCEEEDEFYDPVRGRCVADDDVIDEDDIERDEEPPEGCDLFPDACVRETFECQDVTIEIATYPYFIVLTECVVRRTQLEFKAVTPQGECTYFDDRCYFENGTVIENPHLLYPPARPSACHDGLGWADCDDHPHYLSSLNPDPIDVTSYFPACYLVGDIQVTPCGPTNNGPDLLVSDIDVVNFDPTAGDALQIDFSITNFGGELSPNAKYRLQISGPGGSQWKWGWTGSFDARYTRHFSVSTDDLPGLTDLPGQYTIEVMADYEDTVGELSESNNARTAVAIISEATVGGTDVSISAVSMSPGNPADTDTVTLGFEIKNNGTTTLDEVSYVVQVDGPSPMAELVSLPELPPGQTHVEHHLEQPDSGQYDVYVVVDPTNDIEEDYENNNFQDRSFTVQESTATCLPCTSGNPNHVGAQLCLDDIDEPPHEGSIWQCDGVRANGTSCNNSGNHPNGWSNIGPRCPDPSTLPPGWHPDLCGNPGICPGS